MNTFHIFITVVVTSALWLIYIKFFYQRNNLSEKEALRIKDDQIKEKDHEIEKIQMSHENEIKLLNEKYTSVENIKNNLQETLTNERESSKVTLSTLKNVEAWKTTVTSDMQDNSNLIKKQQNFIDKLTNNQKYQGNFGEKFLEQSLQFHGFKKGIDYTKQEEQQVYNLDKDSIEKNNPDIYINLTDENHIVCDSKVSLDNWKKFVNAETDAERDEEFKKHALAVKKHIDNLAQKNYMKNIKKKVFHKVIMYMCHEASYLSALEYIPDLYEYAYKKNILLCGPKNLFAVISICQTIQDKEKQIKGVKNITDIATTLMEKYSLVKSHLIKTMTSFNAHGKNLENVIKGTWQGKGSLEQRITKLEDQGINPKNPIPKTKEIEDQLMRFEVNEEQDNKDLN
mgnify:CR=1 FL=1